MVLQDPFLFSGTVADNIRLGSRWIQDESVEGAAEQVNVADFIRSLPGGFDEEVQERGSTLSTGQKQLISFARALAHNPKILVLDEATSSVDTETEFRVREALDPHGRGPHVAHHRASAEHHSARQQDHRDAQGQGARDWQRISNCWRSAEFIGSCISCSTRTRRFPRPRWDRASIPRQVCRSQRMIRPPLDEPLFFQTTK